MSSIVIYQVKTYLDGYFYNNISDHTFLDIDDDDRNK